ncbi:SOS response-associated peptidase [Acinetobacter sp. DSM 11652]|uniref:SOS response-associated peptidase n=1 Tax=Acinetobacter sp. DSM 11652 TaxID=346222 RepID=UPI0008B2F906|nr:SOS response-associated peptidase family protein [Acinetobacter sp. DSM 11652]SEM06410.1 SOS response associated peptidase (SRAP) [Acinetobacter sp. DSM 11652]
MCANFKPIQAHQIQTLELPHIPFEYVEEVYPSYETPLLFKGVHGYEWRLVNFGFIPKWATDTEIAKKTYNARSETLSAKRSFQEAFEKCKFGVIPVTEFYEAKYINGRPQRWGVRRKDGQAFFIAALYEITKIDQIIYRSATMITMDAIHHEMMKDFHEPGDVKRSVIIIPHYKLDQWLSLKSPDIQNFVEGFPVEEFECFYCPKPRQNNTAQLNMFDDGL